LFTTPRRTRARVSRTHARARSARETSKMQQPPTQTPPKSRPSGGGGGGGGGPASGVSTISPADAVAAANVLFEQGDPEAALGLLLAARADAPDHVPALDALGEVLAALGRAADASEWREEKDAKTGRVTYVNVFSGEKRAFPPQGYKKR
jgi:hypothetical protein